MTITRTDIAASLERGVRSGFLASRVAYQPQRSPFTQDVPSVGAYEIYADLGAPPWPVANGGQTGDGGTDARTGARQRGGLGDGGPVTIVGGSERSMIVYNEEWEITIGIRHSAINDNRTGDLVRWANSAGTRFEQHKDFLAFDALKNGGGSTYGLGFDGLSFFNDAHIYPKAEYTTGQDNNLAVAISVANYQVAKAAGRAFKDSRGIPLGLNHQHLVVASELEYDGTQITQNMEVAGVSTRDMNPFAGNTTMQIAPGGWLTATNWFAVDRMAPAGILIQDRESPQLVIWDDHSQGSGVRYFKWEARYAVFYGSWPSIIRCNV